MGFKPKLGLIVGGMMMGLLTIGQANATTLNYSGALSGDDQDQLYSYTLASSSPVIFQTNSYATGGFVPVISLFSSTGMEIASDGGDETCSAGMSAAPATGRCNDAYLLQDLAAGSYTIAVTEFYNVPVGPNLSDGFLMQGQGNFTGATCGATGAFYETDVAPCVQDTANFSLNVTATPEPSTIWLGALPLVLFGIARRRHVAANNS
jgi:hypothetical protein